MKSIEALYKLNRMTLNEDIPDIDYDLEVDSDLDGPDRGIETGVAGLLLDQISKVAQNINDYNMLRANLEDYPEIDELIKDLADQENETLGKLQSALKSISPNAELIMNGAVEAEADFPLDEDFDNSNPYEIHIFLNSATAERRPLSPEDVDDFIVENPSSEEEFFEILEDLGVVDLADIRTEKELIDWLEGQDYGFGDPIIYKVIFKGATIYDDSDYFEQLQQELSNFEGDFPLDEKYLYEKNAVLDDNDKEFYATYFVGEALEKSNTFKPIEDVVVNQYQNTVNFTIEKERFSANISIVKE